MSLQMLDFLKEYYDAIMIIFAAIGGGFILYKYFNENKAQNNGDNLLTLQKYVDKLIREKDRRIKELEKLSGTDKKRAELEKEISVLKNKLLNAEQSYQQEIEDLNARLQEFESLKGVLPEEQFEKAKQAIKKGDNKTADTILQQVEQQQAEYAAKAAHLRGEIAESNIDYQTAKQHYENAVRHKSDDSTYLNSLGSICWTLAEYQQAIQCFEQALASNLKTYGEDHPQVATYRNNLGLVWKTLGEYEKAIDYYEQALASDLNTYDEDHPNVAIRRNNLGSAWESLGQYEKAIDYYEQALASDLKTYGEDHPNVATMRNNLGSAWESLGQYEKAIGYYEQALASDLKSYGEDHPEVAIDRNNLGSAWKALGQYEKAIGYYEQALASDLKTYGEDHPKVATRHNNLGSAWKALGEYEKAITYYEQALVTFEKVLGLEHPSTQTVKNNLQLTKEAQSKEQLFFTPPLKLPRSRD